MRGLFGKQRSGILNKKVIGNNFALSDELEVNGNCGTTPAGFQGIQHIHPKVELSQKASKTIL